MLDNTALRICISVVISMLNSASGSAKWFTAAWVHVSLSVIYSELLYSYLYSLKKEEKKKKSREKGLSS